jgi:hypothetical protein
VLQAGKEVGLAGASGAEKRQDASFARRGAAILLDERLENAALAGEDPFDVVEGADGIVAVAGELLTERIALAGEQSENVLTQGGLLERERHSRGPHVR